jgi:hypothetical protein
MVEFSLYIFRIPRLALRAKKVKEFRVANLNASLFAGKFSRKSRYEENASEKNDLFLII